jgi:3-hydroxy-9,10-secoandrosta-1,3,5(10)-triene-9,17-dione monooxygenase reductase component
MELTPEIFRDVLGRLAGGVSVVTTVDSDGRPRGCTATAVCSVSLEPPLVLVCVSREASTRGAIRSAGRYALSFLDADARSMSERFASAEEGKFDGVPWNESALGCPLLPHTLAWVECEVEREVDGGDHTIFIGRVVSGAVERPDGEPLVHFRGRYHGPAEPGR